MSSKVVTFRVPEEVFLALESHSEMTGEDRTAFMLKAIKEKLGFETGDTRLPYERYVQEAIAPLQKKLDELEARLQQTGGKKKAA